MKDITKELTARKNLRNTSGEATLSCNIAHLSLLEKKIVKIIASTIVESHLLPFEDKKKFLTKIFFVLVGYSLKKGQLIQKNTMGFLNPAVIRILNKLVWKV